jgi:hypothetical protein
MSRQGSRRKNPIEAFDGSFEYILTDNEVSDFTFALRIEGDSMEPDFKAGDVIIVDPEVEPTPESLLWPRTVGLKRPLKNIGLLTRITWAASISSLCH